MKQALRLITALSLTLGATAALANDPYSPVWGAQPYDLWPDAPASSMIDNGTAGLSQTAQNVGQTFGTTSVGYFQNQPQVQQPPQPNYLHRPYNMPGMNPYAQNGFPFGQGYVPPFMNFSGVEFGTRPLDVTVAPAPEPKPQIIIKEVEVEVEVPVEQPPRIIRVPQIREVVRTRTVKERDPAKFYFGASGTLPIVAEYDYNMRRGIFTTSPAPIVRSTTDSDPNASGYSVQGFVGFECCNFPTVGSNKIRFELEGGYSSIETTDTEVLIFASTTTSQDGYSQTELYTAAANLYFDFGTPQSRFRPYFGGGVGGASAEIRFEAENDGLTGSYLGASDKTYLVQGMAGAGFELSDNVIFNLGYRYRHIGSMGEFDDEDEAIWNLELEHIHSVEAGIRFRF